MMKTTSSPPFHMDSLVIAQNAAPPTVSQGVSFSRQEQACRLTQGQSTGFHDVSCRVSSGCIPAEE